MSEIKLIRVRDVMKTKFDRVDGITTVADALHNMQYPEVRALVVNKRHENDEFGMLFFKDIARNILAKDRAPERVNVYEIMVKPALSVRPDMDIRYCARFFDQFKVLRVPVIEDNEVIGIVGYSDIVLRGMTDKYKFN